MTLVAEVGVRLGALDLDLALEASPDEVVAVVGPNGAGKSTLLRALAGLVRLGRGRIVLGDRVLADARTGAHVAPEGRRVAVVFQDTLLFPHLSALDNVAYGLRARGAGRADARRRGGDWLGRVGLAVDHHHSRPGRLSGGQAQRVALARALATEPELLLLDEPLSAVDAAAKGHLRRVLRERLAVTPGVRLVVTHDPVDAMTLADRLVVVEDGRVTQEGPIAEVTTRPRSAWVARLVGLNLFRGRGEGGRLVLPGGSALTVATTVEGPAFALVHPRAVTLHRRPPESSARNAWAGRAAGLHFEGDRARVEVDGTPPIVAEVTPAAATELRLAEGGRVWVSVKATEIDVYPG
ncbi:MAG TPA: ABC transporter ATP-binding protein [Acidimicrobiales bacterium]|nr:ABC transporter ATP-binding protein [Acidimicrobiales bacterium]